jgi:C4-dicarboxylate transporter DctM subunit
MNQFHRCVLMIMSLGLGFITPPMGLKLFVVSGLTGQPIMRIARHALPFVLAMVLVSILIAFTPELSLWAIKR